MTREVGYSRRNFLKGAAVTSLGTLSFALVGCGNTPTPSEGGATQSTQSALTAGTYIGTGQGRAGEITVELTVNRDAIVKAQVTKSSETEVISDNAIKGVLTDILEYQCLDVDVVSGATLTSMGVKSAAKQALEQAGDISAFEGSPNYPAPVCEDCSADVVIIGAGSAGMNAACTLKDLGKNVILVEKQGFFGGGDTMFASSGMAGGGGYTVYKNKIENATEQDYLEAKTETANKSGLPVDLDSLAAYALRSGDALDNYVSIGVPFGKWAKFSNTITNGSSPGTHIIKRLGEQIVDKGIDYRLNTKLKSIVKSGNKVTGVVVENASGEYTISADAVLLASGGFGYNEDMLSKYADAAAYNGLPHSGSASAMGEGILAAEAIGADLYNMTAIKANNICHVTERGAVISLATIQSVAVLVDNTGNRFIKEFGTTVHNKANAELELPGQEAWAIFDQTMLDQKKLIRDYNALGYFKTGATWEELADAMEYDATAKADFVATMNKWQATGVGNIDEDFGAKVASIFDNPPYFAARIKPAMQSTYGGVHVDPATHVIDTEGNVIPGLYAAGAVSGHGCFGNEVGNGLTIASAFGIIAGETIAADLA